MTSRGVLIVFEGLDKSGKTTQSKLLSDALQNENNQIKCELWKYPNRTTNIGMLINNYLTNKTDLNDHLIHLLFSANRWETVDEMKQKLNCGVNLVVDRYAYSGTAYTAAKNGMNFEWCKSCDVGLPKPDIVFFLDTKPDIACKREEYGGERYEYSEFQNLVYNNYKKFFNESNFCILDASDTIENLHKKILSNTMRVIESCKNNNIEFLW